MCLVSRLLLCGLDACVCLVTCCDVVVVSWYLMMIDDNVGQWQVMAHPSKRWVLSDYAYNFFMRHDLHKGRGTCVLCLVC